MSGSLRAIIVDDEPIAREILRSGLAPDEGVDVVAECADREEAIAAIEEHDPDVVFLDIEMPGGDGFSVIEAVGAENMPLTVFVTAYDHYALRAFEVVAADYLLKPFDEARLARTLERLRERIAQPNERSGERIVSLLEELRRPEDYPTQLAVDSGNHLSFIPIAEIDRIAAEGKHSLVYVGGSTHLMREGLASVVERLSPDEFIRVHRSHVVRIDRVREVHRWSRGGYRLVLADGTKLTSGGRFKRGIESVLLGGIRPPH